LTSCARCQRRHEQLTSCSCGSPAAADLELTRRCDRVSVPAASVVLGLAQPDTARERGDTKLRAAFFGAIALVVYAVLIAGSVWLTTQLASTKSWRLSLRIGLSWLFLTCLSFLPSAVS
jgi:hypothetical protein